MLLSSHLIQLLKQDVVAAWQPNVQVQPSKRASVVERLIDTWNAEFFLRRGVHFTFDRVRKPSRRRSTSRGSRGSRGGYSDDSHSDDFDSEGLSESEDDDDPRYRNGSRAGSRIGRRIRRRGADKSWSLRVECVQMRGRLGPGPGGVPGGAVLPGAAQMGGNPRLNGGQMGVSGMVDPRFAGAPMTNPPITYQGINYT